MGEYQLKHSGPQIDNALDRISGAVSVVSMPYTIGYGTNYIDGIKDDNDTLPLSIFAGVPKEDDLFYFIANTKKGDIVGVTAKVVRVAMIEGIERVEFHVEDTTLLCHTTILESTNNANDRTEDIKEMLNRYGVCTLGKGDFYIKNLDMVPNTTIQGSGLGSRLILDASVEDGYAIHLGPHCTVQDIALYGQPKAPLDIATPTAIGKRHGIIMDGKELNDEGYATKYAGRYWPVISNCFIAGFTGGGIMSTTTGYASVYGVNALNCKIYKCGIGIDIPDFSEYHRFTSVICQCCYYGCRNNGGNNMFMNCAFNFNEGAGFLIKDGFNGSHGSAVGCVFNHNGKAPAIKISDATNGFIFQGGQIFDGNIEITNSKGIVFNSMNIGADINITVTNGEDSGLVLFSDCACSNTPTLTGDLRKVKIRDCFTWTGESLANNAEDWHFTTDDDEEVTRKVLLDD